MPLLPCKTGFLTIFPWRPSLPRSNATADKPSRRATSRPGAAAVSAQWAPIAARLPPMLRMGCSTWSYPGWEDLVWDGAYDASMLTKNGLSAYAQHPLLRTVCIDRSFWRPLTVGQHVLNAARLPADFRCVVKCPSVVTDAQVRAEDGRRREANPAFLDPLLAQTAFVLPTLDGLGDRLGVLVFQLAPCPGTG